MTDSEKDLHKLIDNIVTQNIQNVFAELNNKETWEKVEQSVFNALFVLEKRNVLYSVKVVCDATINPPLLIDKNKMQVSVYYRLDKDNLFILHKQIRPVAGTINFEIVTVEKPEMN